MSPVDPILHGEAGAAETITLAKVLALKDIAWFWCAKAGLEGDGGEAGLANLLTRVPGPVLQIGCHFYAGNERILIDLDERFPWPTIFPNGNRGMPLALSTWSRRFAALGSAIGRGRAEEATLRLELAANMDLIERQMSDGRDFLQGAEAGLADFQAFGPMASLLARHGLIAKAALKEFPSLPGWFKRLEALGEGDKSATNPAETFGAMTDEACPEASDGGGQALVSAAHISKPGEEVLRGLLEPGGPSEIVVRHRLETGETSIWHLSSLSFLLLS